MPNNLTLNISTLSSTVPINRTIAEWSNILQWFIANTADPMPEGLTTAQQNQWKLDQASAKLANYIRSEARRNRLNELKASSTLDTQADSDVAL